MSRLFTIQQAPGETFRVSSKAVSMLYSVNQDAHSLGFDHAYQTKLHENLTHLKDSNTNLLRYIAHLEALAGVSREMVHR